VISENRKQQSIVGCLLGTVVGDALGLPCEALSRGRQQKLYPEISGHQFIFGHGMVSDDSEHTCMVAQTLLVSAGDPTTFASSLARRLRFLLLSFPPAVGLAALHALFKLWLGFSPARSGVFSPGMAPPCASAILGVCFGDDPGKAAQVSLRFDLNHAF
jgi:ADP-ribosyl-[dinitrogen reductase] hydrolase